jgi:tetratricopeptide (TPR) repeat protein
MGIFGPPIMKSQQISFEISLEDFDLSRLPVDESLLKGDKDLLAATVRAYYEDCFRNLGGSTSILISGGKVSVTWFGGETLEQAVLDHAVSLLHQREFSAAEPLLRSVLGRDPKNGSALYNLGMMLSDSGRLDEAIECLKDLVHLREAGANGWVALGVAQKRKGLNDEALESLNKAALLEPDNGYALRNLAAVLGEESPRDALPFFVKATDLLPDDPNSHLGLSQCLLALGKDELADAALKRTIEIDPYGPLAEMARSLRTKLSEKFMREDSGASTHGKAVDACLQALRIFEAGDAAKIQTIAFEVAMLGRSGLDINDPEQKYQLKTLPGQFSGLQLVALMYVGFRRIAPGLDAGIDLSKEYEQATELFQQSEQ